MASGNGRGALRGAEVHTLDLIFEVLTAEEWAVWLSAPLERADAKGHRDLAQMLVGAGAEIGGALHDAVGGGHREIVNDLLESGTSITAMDADGRTPLHIAAGWGQTEMVQLLLLKGADKDVLDHLEFTPLYLAAQHGHLATTLALLAAGADVNLRCGEFKPQVIHVTAYDGHVEILRAVIEHGVDLEGVDTRRRTALHLASTNNKATAIDVLLGAGANIEARDHHGYTPLHYASDHFHREALLCLLKHGATINAQSNFIRTSSMGVASQAGRQGAAEVVDSLLRAGADETIVDDQGRKASNMVGVQVEEANTLAEDVERLRELLANALADRD